MGMCLCVHCLPFSGTADKYRYRLQHIHKIPTHKIFRTIYSSSEQCGVCVCVFTIGAFDFRCTCRSAKRRWAHATIQFIRLELHGHSMFGVNIHKKDQHIPHTQNYSALQTNPIFILWLLFGCEFFFLAFSISNSIPFSSFPLGRFYFISVGFG